MKWSFRPLTLRELVVGLVFVVGVEVEDALYEVLAEHFRVLLQQQVEQAVFTQTGTETDTLDLQIQTVCVCVCENN